MRLANFICLIILLFCVGSSPRIAAYKGVLDRIEGEQAIVLIESIDQTVAISKSTLPVGSEINMWFHIERIDYTYKIVSIDHELTEKRKRKSTHLLNRLRKR